VKDLSISRTTFDWGIKVPGNDKHVVYVWLDALANYITAIGYGAEDRDDLTAEQKQAELAKFERYWPADIHLVGKEITRFHCVYWPAFLMAAGLPLPKSVVANGWLLFEESKMSKSRGNVVRTETILDAFGDEVYGKQFPGSTKAERDLFAADVLRYFLLREIPFGQDGSFSFDALITRYNADLANGYGNLVSRTLKLVETGLGGAFLKVHPMGFAVGSGTTLDDSIKAGRYAWTLGTSEYADELWETSPSLEQAFSLSVESNNFSQAIELISQAIKQVDGFLSEAAPWKIAKETSPQTGDRLNAVLYTAAESIRIITALLYPVMPYATASVWRQLGLGDIEEAARNGELKNLQWGGLKPGTKLGPLAPIFPRADKGLAQIMTDMENPTTPAAAEPAKPAADPTAPTAEALNAVSPATDQQPATSAPAVAAPTDNLQPATGNSPTITIDDFAKIDLRVAQIVVAERIPKADKLLRLEVDLGPGFDPPRRQILAGIAEYYAPETLIGRKVVIVANLAPRKMRGLESQGMIVAAAVGPNGAPVLAGFLENVEIGSRLK
jgi:methionyl-tRNA synthetase